MLTLLAPQPESLWDESLPVEVKELPEDLAALDVVLADHGVVVAVGGALAAGVPGDGPAGVDRGPPDDRAGDVCRLMVLKQRYRWGYRTLVAEVSDSIHLRRFCRISLTERVPDESTVRKLTRRIGAETVAELTRAMIVQATREKRFRPRAVRIDSTVIEADMQASDRRGAGIERGAGAGAGGPQARQADRGEEGAGAGSLAGDGPEAAGGHPDDPPALGRGQAGGAEADRRDRRAVGALDQRSAPARARGAGAGRVGAARRRSSRPPPRWRSWRIAARRSQVRSVSGSRASRSRIGSCRCTIRTPGRSARASSASGRSSGSCQPVGGGDRTHPSAVRGVDPARVDRARQPGENTLLPRTVAELKRLGISPREVAVDGGFKPGPTNAALAELAPRPCSSLAARNPAPSAPSAGCGATEPARRAGSATSNAATGWTDPA